MKKRAINILFWYQLISSIFGIVGSIYFLILGKFGILFFIGLPILGIINSILLYKNKKLGIYLSYVWLLIQIPVLISGTNSNGFAISVGFNAYLGLMYKLSFYVNNGGLLIDYIQSSFILFYIYLAFAKISIGINIIPLLLLISLIRTDQKNKLKIKNKQLVTVCIIAIVLSGIYVYISGRINDSFMTNIQNNNDQKADIQKLGDTKTKLIVQCIASKDYNRLYNNMAEYGKQNIPIDQFTSQLKNIDNLIFNNLSGGYAITDNPFEMSSGSLNVNNNQLSIEGRYMGKEEGLTVNLELIKENGDWKIGFFRFGVKKEIALPSEDEINNLVKKTISSFAKSISSRNFHDFYENGFASMIKNQVSEEDIYNNFSKFSDTAIDFNIYEEANFDDSPYINENGILILKGHYFSKPDQYKILFELQYFKQKNNWKLTRFNIGME